LAWWGSHVSLRVQYAAAAGFVCLLALGCGPDAPSSPTAPAEPVSKSGIGLPSGWLSTPRLFATGTRFTSLTATPARLVAATLGDAPSKLVQLGECGEVMPFAPEFAPGSETRCCLELFPTTGNFVADDLVAGYGNELWHIAQDGSAVVRFASLPADCGGVTGLVFDTAGTFHFDLLVLTDSGWVYRVDGRGNVVPVASVGAGASGPSLAPQQFDRFAGELLLAFPAESEVRALDASGAMTSVLRWSGVSGTCVVPDDPRAYGGTEATLFVATDGGPAYKYPLADVAGRAGAVLLTSNHRSGSGLVIPEPGGFRIRPFSRSMGAERAATFVRRPAITRVSIDILPGFPIKWIQLGTTSLVPVGLFASTGFTPSILDGGDVTFAGARPVSRRSSLGTFTDLDGDGRMDLLLQFRVADMQLPVGDATLTLDGTALAGDHVRGSGRVVVLAP